METTNKKILVSGGNGLVGSRIIELLKDKYSFTSLDRPDGFDVTNPESFSKFAEEGADYFLHLAAKTDVDGCEGEKNLGEESEAWRINVKGTENVVRFCIENNIKPILISTDFVFDGEKKEGGFYTEEDHPNPINFYARTKHEAEKIVGASNIDYMILRIAYPYRKEYEVKKDFVRAIRDRLAQSLEVRAVTDHVFCPTFIDDIASVIDKLIESNGSGIYHSVGGAPITPYDAANLIAEKFNLEKSLIKPTTRAEYFQEKAQRPFNLYLKNVRIENLGLKTKTFTEGLLEIKKS